MSRPLPVYQRLEVQARQHAAGCAACFIPIIDDEGNPGYRSEACAKGLPILEAYISALEAEELRSPVGDDITELPSVGRRPRPGACAGCGCVFFHAPGCPTPEETARNKGGD